MGMKRIEGCLAVIIGGWVLCFVVCAAVMLLRFAGVAL